MQWNICNKNYRALVIVQSWKVDIKWNYHLSLVSILIFNIKELELEINMSHYRYAFNYIACSLCKQVVFLRDTVKCNFCHKVICMNKCKMMCSSCGEICCKKHYVHCNQKESDKCWKGVCEKCITKDNEKWKPLTCCGEQMTCKECINLHGTENCRRCWREYCVKEMEVCSHYFCKKCVGREVNSFIGQDDFYIVDIFEVCEWCVRKETRHVDEYCDMCEESGDIRLCMFCSTHICHHIAERCCRGHLYCSHCSKTQIGILEKSNGVTYGVCSMCMWRWNV